ncbi:MAG: hypothetical protein RMJ51_05110 [Candidatus Calescibacterium sp.]|nr:hypothetical protein [Candidatus Calescibacterium sp.]MDW8195599.1 hypothetical protein [Candidatus Calescibacterium sp.]
MFTLLSRFVSIFCFILFLLLLLYKTCWSQVYVEKDFLLYSKENRIGIYYSFPLSNKVEFTLGYEKTLREKSIITMLSFSNDGIHKVFLLHEKNSIGFAVERILNENNSIYLEINNMRDEDLNLFYYSYLFENVSLKIGLEKINKKNIDPLIGIYIEF